LRILWVLKEEKEAFKKEKNTTLTGQCIDLSDILRFDEEILSEHECEKVKLKLEEIMNCAEDSNWAKHSSGRNGVDGNRSVMLYDTHKNGGKEMCWSKNMWDIMTRENISCPEIIALMRREESKCTNTFEMENGGQDAVRSFLNDAQHTASSTLSR
jgi:hypothetical protein